MIYITGIIVCIVVIFANIIIYSVKAYKHVKLGKTDVRLYLIISSIVLSIFFVFIFTFVLLYNYNFEKGVNLTSKNNTDAYKHLNNALKIRQILGPIDTFFDIKFFGFSPLFPSEMLTRRRLANAYRLNENYQKAIEEYEQIESFYNNDFDVIAGMADSYFMLSNVEKTEYYYAKLINTKRDNKDVNYYFHMGMAYLILMDCDNAEMYLKKSIDLGKDSKGVNRLIEKCKGRTITNTDVKHSGQPTMD